MIVTFISSVVASEGLTFFPIKTFEICDAIRRICIEKTSFTPPHTAKLTQLGHPKRFKYIMNLL